MLIEEVFVKTLVDIRIFKNLSGETTSRNFEWSVRRCLIMASRYFLAQFLAVKLKPHMVVTGKESGSY